MLRIAMFVARAAFASNAAAQGGVTMAPGRGKHCHWPVVQARKTVKSSPHVYAEMQ